MTYKLTGVIVYLIVLVIIGLVAARRMKDVRDFFAAGKRLGYLAVAFSARATGESAWLLLGLTGMGAAVGVQALWVVLGEVLGVGSAWLLLARRFKRLTDRYDSITIPDYLESRFRDQGHLLRLVSAGSLVVFVTIYVSAQIDATGTAFNAFVGWNYYLGATIGFAVVIAYIVCGGFLAVAWSDVFQGSMMFLGLVSLPVVAVITAGGWDNVAAELRAQEPGLLSPWGPEGFSAVTIFSILSFALIGLGFLGSPQIFVRFIALRNERGISAGALVAILWTILADTGAVLTGMIGRYLLVDSSQQVESVLGSSGQNVLPMTVELIMPALLVGLYVAVVLSAIMSTVDSLLVVASSAVVRDYWQKVRRPQTPDAALVGMSRKTTFVLALAAFAVALTVAVLVPGRTVFWFVIFGWSGIAATFCPTIILSLFWSRMTARGALFAMICGFVSVPFFKFVGPHLPFVGIYLDALEELAPAFCISAIAGILVSHFDRPRQHTLAGVENDLQRASRRP